MRWWIRFAAAIIALALLVWLGWSMISGLVDILSGADLNLSDPDPMFAEEAQLPTRPPELDMEIVPPDRPTLDDYVPEVETPVDKTADELILEAQQKADT